MPVEDLQLGCMSSSYQEDSYGESILAKVIPATPTIKQKQKNNGKNTMFRVWNSVPNMKYSMLTVMILILGVWMWRINETLESTVKKLDEEKERSDRLTSAMAEQLKKLTKQLYNEKERSNQLEKQFLEAAERLIHDEKKVDQLEKQLQEILGQLHHEKEKSNQLEKQILKITGQLHHEKEISSQQRKDLEELRSKLAEKIEESNELRQKLKEIEDNSGGQWKYMAGGVILGAGLAVATGYVTVPAYITTGIGSYLQIGTGTKAAGALKTLITAAAAA